MLKIMTALRKHFDMRGIGRTWHVRPYTVPASEYVGLEHRSCDEPQEPMLGVAGS